MIISVFGPRDNKDQSGQNDGHYNNYSYIAECLSEYDAVSIVSGGGFGVEQLALRYANEIDIGHQIIPPNIEKYSHGAWPIRNRQIVSASDLVVLFWDGKDKFYYALMEEAVKQKKLIHIHSIEY
jgi:hypothetical protein